MDSPMFNPLLAGGGSEGSPMPLPTDPGQTAQMMGGGPVPSSSPVQPANGGMTPDLMALITRMAQNYQEPAMQNLSNVAGQMGQVAQSIPGQVPKMGPSIDKGAGFLHNLGQALLMVGNMTGVGRELNDAIYGPNIRRYKAGQQQKVQQLEALKGEAGASGEEASAASRGIEGLGLAGYRQGELGIQQQKVTAYTQGVQNRLMTAMRGLNLKELQAGSQMELNKARTALAQAMPDILQQRNQLTELGIDTRSATQQTVANILAQTGIDKEHPFAQMLDNMLGTSLTPAAPQAQGGAQPVQGPSKLPAKSATPAKAAKGRAVPAGTVVYDPTGKPHRADGTAPLPQGWSLSPKGR